MEPGALVADRYQIIELAGRGGMGVVYRARDEQTGTIVAVKVVSSDDETSALRFKREARALSMIAHPSVVRYIDYGNAGSSLFMVMDWIDGEDLRVRLQRGPLSIAETLEVGCRVAGALEAIHAAGLVHRDLKPGNLRLQDGRTDGVRVVDFGVVRLQGDATRLTSAGFLIGTPGYSAPEQVRGDEAIDGRADVFALGAVLYACLTGRKPFSGESIVAVLGKVLFDDVVPISALNGNADDDLDALIARMLSKNATDRPQAMEVKRSLEMLSSALGRSSMTLSSRPPAPVTHAERRLASVVVVGRRGATDPRVTRRLRGHGDPVPAIVESFGGRVALLVDGTVLAAFAPKGAVSDQTERAARCALALHARHTPGEIIVVSTGLVDAADAHMPVGEALECAGSMLRDALGAPEAAGGDAVRIDDVSVAFLTTGFEIDRAGTTAQLLRQSDDEQSSQTERKHRTPFVGREQELSWLMSMLAESLDDRVTRVAIVSGSTGSGKTRLREELLSRVRQTYLGLAIHVVRCDAATSSSAFTLARRILAGAVGVREGEPDVVRRHKLEVEASAGLEREGSTKFLAELLGSSDEVKAVDDELLAARSDPILMGDRLRVAWEDWLTRACARGPMLVVIEDAHDADPPSIALLDRAMRMVGAAPLTVIATARPEITEHFPRLWEQHAPQWIPLRRLSRRASEQIVALAGIEGLQATGLVERAQGNAMVLEELIAAHARGQRDEFPETLLALVNARLATLDGDSRRVLRAASVMGVVFHRSAVRALVGEPQELLGERMRLLALRGLIVDRRSSIAGEHEYAFTHPVVRDAVYATLPKGERERAHDVAASWLMRVGVRDAAILADHLERSGRSDEAVKHLRSAAETALAGGDFVAALRFADRGVAIAKGHTRAELDAVAGDALWWSGEAKQSFDRLKLALGGLRIGSVAFYQTSGGFAGAAFAVGAPNEALEAIRNAHAAPPEEGALVAKFSGLARFTYGALLAGHVGVARELLAWLDGAEANIEANAHVARARLLQARALWETIEGDLSAYVPLTRAAQEHYRAIGDMRNRCWQEANLASTFIELGAYAEAVASLRSLLASGDIAAVPPVIDIAKNNLGLALGRLGELDEGLAVEREAVVAFASRGHARMEGASRAYVAEMLWRKNDFVGAAREADRARQLLGDEPLGHYAAAVASFVARGSGDAKGALDAALRAAKPVMQGASIDEGESFIRLSLVEALLATGDDDAARYAARAARDYVGRRAARILDEHYRAVFLTEPINARILELH